MKSQNADGGWGQGGGWRINTSNQGGRVEGENVAAPSDIGNTAIVLQCLLRSGASLDKGDHSAESSRADPGCGTRHREIRAQRQVKRADFLRILLPAPLGARQVSAAAPSPDLAIRFLLGHQSEDGAWRSDTYRAFRDGRALTPHVLRCLARFDDPALAAAKNKAVTSSASPAPMQQPNLSATAIAIDGLRAAGGNLDAITRAIPFVRSCQNHGTGDPAFDDGGFFQILLDPKRNKAGAAGTDRHGNPRFNSYAAATADGLRCFLSAGLPLDSPRVMAARQWLDRFTWSPDAIPADLAYYGARSISLTASMPGGSFRAAKPLRQELHKAALPDHSWKNPAIEMRENDPIVATALALEASIG